MIALSISFCSSSISAAIKFNQYLGLIPLVPLPGLRSGFLSQIASYVDWIESESVPATAPEAISSLVPRHK